ncbi:MAG: hypothetical protein QGI86_12850 [Candidatus Poribacteria bacterium]|nr:hypothetical protein [Candidatus Poribacteria bacterium]MDP6749682.1 hypothetical protein [Candidatus Poribacteria bacterium]MDP6999572.1 hypothetical protein [Candidatus Poribacteria bacterium]
MAQKLGAVHGEIAPLTFISANTLPAYLPQYLDGGIEASKLLILANTLRLLLNKQQRKSKN